MNRSFSGDSSLFSVVYEGKYTIDVKLNQIIILAMKLNHYIVLYIN